MGRKKPIPIRPESISPVSSLLSPSRARGALLLWGLLPCSGCSYHHNRFPLFCHCGGTQVFGFWYLRGDSVLRFLTLRENSIFRFAVLTGELRISLFCRCGGTQDFAFFVFLFLRRNSSILIKCIFSEEGSDQFSCSFASCQPVRGPKSEVSYYSWCFEEFERS